MTYPCPSVATLVPLDTQQIKYLIDAMWSLTEKDATAICESHGVDDWHLENHLQTTLINALNELN
jgi:hypothetical protein